MTRMCTLCVVEFRLVVFRPFKGEVILGKISSSSAFGIKSKLESWIFVSLVVSCWEGGNLI